MSQVGLCLCGCGTPTKPATRTVRAYGWVKGQPLRFLLGHNDRGPGPEYRVCPDTGCWIWQRSRRQNGYGNFWSNGRKLGAHRVIYERHRGPVPEGLELDHLCRVPTCVNPDHLEPVTHAENIRRGKRTRLSVKSAVEIRASSESSATLARRYGVAKGTIQSVRQGVSWVAV